MYVVPGNSRAMRSRKRLRQNPQNVQQAINLIEIIMIFLQTFILKNDKVKGHKQIKNEPQ